MTMKERIVELDRLQLKIKDLIKRMGEPKLLVFNTQCECGMEKHGFSNHSTWCPKFS